MYKLAKKHKNGLWVRNRKNWKKKKHVNGRLGEVREEGGWKTIAKQRSKREALLAGRTGGHRVVVVIGWWWSSTSASSQNICEVKLCWWANQCGSLWHKRSLSLCTDRVTDRNRKVSLPGDTKSRCKSPLVFLHAIWIGQLTLCWKKKTKFQTYATASSPQKRRTLRMSLSYKKIKQTNERRMVDEINWTRIDSATTDDDPNKQSRSRWRGWLNFRVRIRGWSRVNYVQIVCSMNAARSWLLIIDWFENLAEKTEKNALVVRWVDRENKFLVQRE